jgi:pSer/pThr/pTyr-binding forkhead associated (FHA) protein
MSAKLYLNFPQTNLRREVSPDGETIFGRTSASDIDLTGYFEGHPKTISRQHFKISYSKGEGFILVDLSLNGTRVNEVNLAPGERRILRHGDVMKLASDENLLITISIEADPDITDTIDDPARLFSTGSVESGSGLYFDEVNSRFLVDGAPIPHEHLTRLETVLLKYLYDNRERLCTFDDIAMQVWSDPGWAPGNNTITRAVSNLRKKLDQISPGASEYIQNIRGQGYKVMAEQISD